MGTRQSFTLIGDAWFFKHGKLTNLMNVTAQLKQKAASLGFNLAGVCPAVEPVGIHRFYQWLQLGYDGQMLYLSDRAKAYEHPRHVLDGACSILMLAMNYRTAGPVEVRYGSGRVSRYAWGTLDYHDVMHTRLKTLVRFLEQHFPGSKARGVVDTAPLLEREFAQLAGLGWVGKNTLLINPDQGSWFFLAAVLTDVTLEYDEPFHQDHCGTCRACLDACPTNAFPEPYVLDSRKCISYLTIELQDQVPRTLREDVDDWVFGCDICQEACPWNGRSPISLQREFLPREDLRPLKLAPLFRMTDDQFRQRFRRIPLWRAKRRGLLRNAAIVLGNQKDESSIADLIVGLNDGEWIVRGACAWALGRMPRNENVIEALQSRSKCESNDQVRQEIHTALSL